MSEILALTLIITATEMVCNGKVTTDRKELTKHNAINEIALVFLSIQQLI
ncbi:MAG: hypothetical protein H6622_08490 [Halobacteriovoraceae bacterium]|nr:hypothetical protein [Halobacteriovoraceae bacterium]